MAEVHQHTPPGGWPHGKNKDVGDHRSRDQSPSQYFDDDTTTLKDTKDAATDTSESTAKSPTKKANGAADDATKSAEDTTESADDATKSTKDLGDKATTPAKDAGESTKESADNAVKSTTDAADDAKPKEGQEANPLDELKAGLKGGKGGKDDSELKEVEPEPIELTDEEKKKLTPGGDISNLSKADDAEGVSKDAKTDLPNGEDAVQEGQDAAEGATKDAPTDLPNSEEAVKDGQDAAKTDLPEGEDTVKDAKTDLPEGELPEGEDAVKDAKTELPEGEDAVKEGQDAATEAEAKVGEADNAEVPLDGEVPKEGEEALKEGEEAAGDATKEGEEGLKEGQQTGEEALKEGEEAAKDGEEAVEEAEPIDMSILKGARVNKGGNLINEDNKVVGRVTEGVLTQLVGKRADENGVIWSDAGKQLGKAELIPDDEREAMLKESAPFEAFPDAKVDGEGYVVSGEDRVGKVVDGDPKKLRNMKVDADGDILDRNGSVVGRAERWEPEPEPEPEPEAEVDRSILAGKRVNKAGYLVDSHGSIFGRVVEGDVKRMIGRMSDAKGVIRSESGGELGRAEVVPEGERDGAKEGPFAELTGCTVRKDGKIVTPGNEVVGRLVSGDPKVLFGREVDDDGEVVDKNGNVIGKAERWEEPEVEKRKNPMAGRRVTRDGGVTDEDGNLVGKLTTGDLSQCAGMEIDDDGDVIDSKGTRVGHVSLLADIKEEEPQESEEDRTKREEAEKDKKLAQQMSYCLTQVLDKIKPICDMITSKIEKAERTPKDELDEEALVRDVRPLIEEGGKILTEANGIIRGLDPDGRIQANAKHKAATRDATPEEYHLADVLKELTGTVTKTIDNAKKKIEGMPHAKKELNPLWGLLSEPLFQILAAVGLLLSGVLGLVGQLLSGLGLGGLVDGLLGGLGIKNILSALGVGGLTDSLTGKKSGKKGGGLLGLGG